MRLVVVGACEEERGVTRVEAEDERSEGGGRGVDTEERGEGVGRVPLGSSHCARRVVGLALYHTTAQWGEGRLTPKRKAARGGIVVGAYGGGVVGGSLFYWLDMGQG